MLTLLKDVKSGNLSQDGLLFFIPIDQLLKYIK